MQIKRKLIAFLERVTDKAAERHEKKAEKQREKEELKKAKIVQRDESRFILPMDIRRKRIFWALGSFFIFLLCLAALLLVLLLDMVSPPGFGAGPISPVANFRTSFYGPADELTENYDTSRRREPDNITADGVWIHRMEMAL